MLPRHGALLALTLLTPACADVEAGPPASVEGAAEGPPQGATWDESLAAGVEPCPATSPASCASETRGACGVIEVDGEPLCLPLFQWGVTPEREVEFASRERVFALADLTLEPLTLDEQEEARALRAVLATAELGEGEPEARAINHSGTCSTSYFYCSLTYGLARRFLYHFNVSGTRAHRHVWSYNQAAPYYGYCYDTGVALGPPGSIDCGTF